MKYIEKVILQNFQSHIFTEIQFDNRLNIIVGPSDSGKTAILRGIRWALFNEPSGDYFIREGESECSVEVLFNDGIRIKRYRSKSKNIYFLYDRDNNEMKFEGFGTSVPEEIIEATGIKKILLDSDISKSINISDQLEGPFLLSERTSTRANSIGRLVGVNIIDDALRESLKDSRNMSNLKKNIDDEIVLISEELLQYDYLDELKRRIDYIETLRNEINEKNKLLAKYKGLLERHEIILKEKLQIKLELEKYSNLEKIAYNISEILDTIKIYNFYNHKKEILKKITLGKKDSEMIYMALKDLEEVEYNLYSVDKLISDTQKLKNLKKKYVDIILGLKKLRYISERLSSLHIVENNINSIYKYNQEYNKLIMINQGICTIRKRLNIGYEYMREFNSTKEIEDIYKELREKTIIINNFNKLSKEYKRNQNEINITKSKCFNSKKDIQYNLGKYEELLQKLEICPLCFSNIDKDKVNHIIKHYN